MVTKLSMLALVLCAGCVGPDEDYEVPVNYSSGGQVNVNAVPPTTRRTRSPKLERLGLPKDWKKPRKRD